MSTNNEEMVVTPWEVRGKIDYDKLTKEFGTQPITPELLDRIRKHTGELHPQQERLLVLQKVREALKWLDQLGDTEGLKYLVLEDEGIPERILFKIS